jgi:lipoprotein-anchoring transpeptidase ErfK/SrfK
MFNGVLYIPPFGTVNRKIPEVLGKFKLDTGDGILIHGTNDPLAVGFWGTHGCVRLFDDDIQFVYENAPVGTPVYIY